jgi:hypothetical protein
MAFDYDELNPLGSTYLADYPANEQGHRAAVLNSSNVDHYPEDGPIDSQSGFHRQLSLPPLGAKPSTVGDAGFVYTKDVDGITELFYLNEDGQDEVQLTSDGTASPDKLPLAGGTLIGALIIDGADLTVGGDLIMDSSGQIILENNVSLMSQNAAAANRAILVLDDSDITELGNAALSGTRIRVDGADTAVIEYGGTDYKIWHEGHFATTPLLQTFYESPLQAIDGANAGGFAHGIAGGTPDLWTAVLRANATDRDYASGEEIPVMAGLSPEDAGQLSSWISVNSTTSRFEWRRSNANPHIFNGTGGGTDYALDDSKWDLVYKAWY